MPGEAGSADGEPAPETAAVLAGPGDFPAGVAPWAETLTIRQEPAENAQGDASAAVSTTDEPSVCENTPATPSESSPTWRDRIKGIFRK
jgi:hypothetical protein